MKGERLKKLRLVVKFRPEKKKKKRTGGSSPNSSVGSAFNWGVEGPHKK